jgi:hypothetical protein
MKWHSLAIYFSFNTNNLLQLYVYKKNDKNVSDKEAYMRYIMEIMPLVFLCAPMIAAQSYNSLCSCPHRMHERQCILHSGAPPGGHSACREKEMAVHNSEIEGGGKCECIIAETHGITPRRENLLNEKELSSALLQNEKISKNTDQDLLRNRGTVNSITFTRVPLFYPLRI